MTANTEQSRSSEEPISGFLLPPGRLAALVALLRWPTAKESPRPAWPKGAMVERCDLTAADFRKLYLDLGAAHLWHSRLLLDDAALTTWLTEPAIDVQILRVGRRVVGLVELDFRQAGLCQIAHLGVLAGFRGRSFGRHLLAHALQRARRPGVHTIWLSTSSFDADHALRFYLKAGFAFDRYAVEIFDDPRLTGILPAPSAPRWPLAPTTLA